MVLMTPEELTASLHQAIPIVAAMGIRVVEARPGYAEAEMPFEPNRNHFGAAYAGSLYTVAELLGGQIVRASLDLDGELAGFVPLLKSSSIRYLLPARGPVRARAAMAAEEIERIRVDGLEHGKANYDLDAEILAEDGTVLAVTSGAYQLRRF